MMNEENSLPIVWYFADPMCSWCWGFSPVISRIRKDYGKYLRVSLNMGGLRPGTQTPITDTSRDEILDHWKHVNELTGQSFKFENALPEGFVYDTEPASRAVLTVGRHLPTAAFEYFTKLQEAFYTRGEDVTRPEVLKKYASAVGINETAFLGDFRSPEMIDITQRHFTRTRNAGIGGFPTLVWQQADEVKLLTAGYQPFDTLASSLDELLAHNSTLN